MGKFKLKDQLAGVAALIAAIVAIGGGFVKYGEITTQLEALSNIKQEKVNLAPLDKKLLIMVKKLLIIVNLQQLMLQKLNS